MRKILLTSAGLTKNMKKIFFDENCNNKLNTLKDKGTH